MVVYELSSMYRPASGEFRFSLPWLAELVGRPEATVGQRRALAIAIYDKGAERRGKARVNSDQGDVQKDDAWGVSPEYIEGVMEAARKWAETAQESSAEMPRPRKAPSQLDRVEERLEMLHEKLDSLLQIIDK